MRNVLSNVRNSSATNLLRLFTFLTLLVMLMAQVSVLIVRAAGTDLTLTKTIEGSATTAQVGDVIRYRIHFACSNLTTPCGPMEITDILQPGLIYQPPPASSAPAGFSINYTAATRTITITKDDNNLLDGSQYDAVIAVQVDYDLRPLPATINNTVNGRIAPTGPGNWENTTPASAPPITIGTANPHWGMTKTLSSPTINPTVDTDVTYQIQLCPTAPPPGEGNVPLRNITITDTMPVGATFVSASNGGTEAAGTVTWPVFAGPLYPPNCLKRFVTIRYNSPAFNIGDNVTNTASANGQYTDSNDGTIGPVGVATNPIVHPIDPISQVPTYSKNDTGDPVGLTGTGRFILDLDTNGTNYPSNQLILIDNLPPQLQVTSVTGGQWSATFDYVRAFVEYSTNNGSSYTAFPGQPISYNTGGIYNAPAVNITNVRWRFDYDPDQTAPFTFTQAGLPYTWSFTTSPEIRVTPRAVATTADPPSGAPLPAAVAGTTYDNCLQVTRNDSSGNPIVDACNIEQMTVQGTFVSLRTSKNETPGGAWDDLSDPNITAFTPDGSILPGDTLLYTVTVEITERSSTPLVNPTIQDTLPAASDFIFVRNGIARLDGVALPAAQQPTFSQAGQVLTWAWNNPSPALTVNPLALGSRFLTVEFYARVPRGQAPGTYTNDLYVVTDSVDAFCEIGTTEQDSANGDVDGDADATDPACRNPDTYIVERSAALRGEKWIRSTDAANSQVVDATTFLPSGTCPNGGTTGLSGGGGNPFTRFPCISPAFPEGALSPGQFAPPPASTTLDDFEYNLRIFNDGNVPMLSYVLYDILPYVGDTGSGGTLSSASRLSEFRPIMRGPVQFISGPSLTSADFTIEYNNTTNPCRPEVFDLPTGGLVPGGCNNTWTTTWSASALSYRIRLNAGSFIPPAATSSEVRLGVPLYIPLDALPAGFDPNDALSHEIAWNSFAHVGAYDSDPGVGVTVQDLLASEPRKVGITVPERMSVGNRVWRDADNNGTINAPDDINPGIVGVTVNLYQDANNDGIADGAAIGTTITDVDGYYLFSNIPYDSAVLNNNRYIIGIPTSNFAVGQALESLRSSTGTPAFATYTNPTSNVIDSADDGIDPVTPGLEVFSWSFTLQPTTEPTSETDLSANDRDGLPGQRRGVNGERNNNSDLTIDFGFFGGTDIPFSIGNHVWKDNGQTAAPGVFNYAQRNDGIRQIDEPPVVGALVRLYRDGNANGIPEAAEMIRTDITDANGFYLFDNLDPGPYFVEIPASNFATGQPLAGWYSSQPTGTENVSVAGNTNTPNMDSDDNGVNNAFPEINGIFSGVVVLTRGVPETTGETHLSGDISNAPGFNPTAGDGPGSIGRFGEIDSTSNLTIDFGFIPVFSVGNRVFFDTNNNSLRNGGEVGINNVRVRLYASDGTTEILVGPDGILNTADDAANGLLTAGGGYYRFNNLPAGDYIVKVAASNFNTGGVLDSYWSSGTTITGVGVISETTAALANSDTDSDDNGTLSGGEVVSSVVTLGPTTTSEPLAEADLSGGQGQPDGQANMTVDFGFYRVQIGDLVYLDNNATGTFDAGDTSITGRAVRLYAADGVTEINVGPDGILGTTDDAAGGMLANGTGNYLFSGLPQGQYVVKTASDAVTKSTIDTFSAADNATPDTNTNNNDNGIGIAGGTVSSGVFTMTPGFAGALGNNTINNGTGTTSNPTLDFGFVGLVALGNRVWIDDGAGGGTANNGVLDGTEAGAPNVTVELYTSTGTFVTSTTTDATGHYQFDLLSPGTYYAFIPATQFRSGGPLFTYYSSVGNSANETTDETTGPTTTENGIDDAAPATNGIRSTNFTLLGGTERTGEDQSNYTGALADANVNFTDDFGFVQKYSIGNRVWFDTNNSSTINGLEVGVDGVTVNLYAASNLAVILATDTTSNGGYYLFDDLYPGDYVVSVAASNFTGVLNGYWSSGTSRTVAGAISETAAALANNDTDSDDNGTLQTVGPLSGAVISSTVTLGPSGNTEPASETDLETGVGQGSQANGRANMTVDFGFYTMTLGNLVWSDTDKNGAFNGGETGLDGLTVELWSGDGTVQFASTTTTSGGLYSFLGLVQGNYVVRVIAPTGTVSSVDSFAPIDTTNPTTNTDNNDNGVGTGGGTIVSNAVTLTPGLTQTSNAVNNLTGSTTNPSLDFGFRPVFSLGNRVWFDTDNSSTINGAEVGIEGVTVNLYAASDLTTIIASQATANGGYYLFNGLQAGDYVVSVVASNFSGVLSGYWSSGTSRTTAGAVTETTAAPANSDTDSDDNGMLQTSGTLNGSVISSIVTLGPNTTNEPGGETDVDGTLPGNQQGQPDTQANMTIDFGFYTITLGNQVWNDLDNSGILDGAEVGFGGVTVELRSGDGSALLGTTTTSGGGFYTFTGLPAGDYIVRLPAVNFNPGGFLRDYRSSTGPLPTVAYEPAPDSDTDTTDSDDNGSEANGLLGLGGYIQTLPITLTPAGEQTFDNTTGTTNENRVDFGVSNSPQLDLMVTKTDNLTFYLAGGTLNYVITVTNNGPADANGMTITDSRPPQIASWTWTCAAGTPAGYNCTDDATNPATFTDSLDLPQLASVTYNVTVQIDPAATGDLINNVTVIPPTGMTDMTPPDNTATDTDQQAAHVVDKDDGLTVVAPDFTTTYTITVTNIGVSDLTGIALVDTVPAGMSFVSASSGGVFASGQITWPLFDLASSASSSFTVQLKVADLASLGGITSFANTVHVQDDGSHTGGTPVESDDTDTDTLASGNTKSLTNTNQAGSANPNVLIGEILTYSIQIEIPVGIINNLKAVDVLDHGLAFVGCDPTTPVSAGSLILAQNPCTTASALTVQNEPSTDTNPASVDAGRHITFDFGQVQNTSGSIQTLIVNYEVIVLDIFDNANDAQHAKGLSNNVTWSWEGGLLAGTAPNVYIVEPDLSVVKDIDPLVASIGSVVTYTIQIEHASTSAAPAYDVLLTDTIPAALALNPASVLVNGTAGLPIATVTTTSSSIGLFWTSFPLEESATITFQAQFVGPSPVINSASVDWSSIQIDPLPALQPQSSYNRYSTERSYDPTDNATNDYRRTSSVTLTTPSLPKTGFASGIRTVLPTQPLDKVYTAIDVVLEIPSLGIKIPIIGVPKKNGVWDVTWLGKQAGWLEGTAFPSWNGNSVLTSHVYDSNGLPGPFVILGKLKYGDKIIIHADGQAYTFEVRTNQIVAPNDTSVLKHEEKPWLTLVTCKEYDEKTNTYRKRVVVRAVLVSVELDK